MDLFLPMLGVGLVTSVHCVTMCGTLVLTYAVRAESDGSRAAKIVPHVAYQSAKIVSYVLVGLALGTIGSLFDVDGLRGWVTLLAGAFMVVLGLGMTGRFPALRRLTPRPPQFVMRALAQLRRRSTEEGRSGRAGLATPVFFGLLTGLMPCGPLQTAQVAAAGAATPLGGAAAMLGFGLGTAPLMLGFGAVSGMLSSRARSRMAVVSAVVVMILGLVMLNRGAMLVGSPVTAQSIRQAFLGGSSAVAEEYVVSEDGYVEVPLVIRDVRFYPDTLRLPADQPVRLIVDRQEDNGCSDQLAVPQLGVLQDLTPFGTTVIELPPAAPGSYTLTCGMGMMSGTITVGTAAPARVPWSLLGALALAAALGGVVWRTSAGRTLFSLRRAEALLATLAVALAIIAGVAAAGTAG